MGRLGLPVAVVVLLLGGCTPKSEPPRRASPASSAEVKKPSPVVHDDFNLPLVIQIETPEAPPEIQGSSQPTDDSAPGVHDPSPSSNEEPKSP
jgi:hypothetical protein